MDMDSWLDTSLTLKRRPSELDRPDTKQNKDRSDGNMMVMRGLTSELLIVRRDDDWQLLGGRVVDAGKELFPIRGRGEAFLLLVSSQIHDGGRDVG